jgi:hypothetical protein
LAFSPRADAYWTACLPRFDDRYFDVTSFDRVASALSNSLRPKSPQLALPARERSGTINVERAGVPEVERPRTETRHFGKRESAALSSLRYSLVRAIYLAAIAAATVGWLWLIAWCASWLI